jgi:hypothetical protein
MPAQGRILVINPELLNPRTFQVTDLNEQCKLQIVSLQSYSRSTQFRTCHRTKLMIRSSSSHPASSLFSPTTTGGNTVSTSGTDYFGSSPIAQSPSESRRTVRQAFESQLSGLLEEFARLESGEYKACYAFAKRYPEIWDCDEKLLLKDAFAALKASKEPHAKRCVQRAVMIQYCKGLSSSKIKNFFDDLIHKEANVLDEFLKDCNDATAKLKAKLPSSFTTTTERPSQQDADHVAGLGSLSLGGGQPRRTVDTRPDDEYPAPTIRIRPTTSGSVPSASRYHNAGGQGSVDHYPESAVRIHRDPPKPIYRQSGSLHSPEEERFSGPISRSTVRTHTDNPTGQEASSIYSRNAAPVPARGRVTSGVPTIFDSEGRTVDELDSRYAIRPNSAGYFIFGRVFATPWHTALGANKAQAMEKWVVKDCFGESILTHIQRMVVVKEGHGFSWCVPITTYQGKGVAKPGLNEEDRRAHAIVYIEGTSARPTAAEKGMMNKRPIAVHAAANDQKLDTMSRINFGKVHTIEHNVKVMNVGRISRDDLEDFKHYWNQHR